MRRRAVATVAAVAALVGCGGGSGDADSPEGPGPVAELMGWEAEDPAEMRRKALAHEELVAECMREEGWEYQPVDWSAQMPDVEDDDGALMMDDPEAYGEKYGYGVVRNYELYEEEGLLSGEDGPGMGMEFEDPNQDYVVSLSESEVTEYYAALQGDPEIWPDSPEESEVFVAPPLEDQGCYGRAQLEVYGEDPMSSNPDLQERMNDFWTRQQDDPRIEEAAAEWAECMDDTIDGLEVYFEPIDQPDDMWAYVDGLKMEAMGLEAEPFDEDGSEPMDAYTVMGGGPDGDGPQVAYVGEPEAIPEDELEELRARELELWRRDHDCQDDVDFAQLRRRIEEEFADELRADFPELTDATDDAGGDAGS